LQKKLKYFTLTFTFFSNACFRQTSVAQICLSSTPKIQIDQPIGGRSRAPPVEQFNVSARISSSN